LSYEDFARLVQPKIFRFSWKTAALPKDPSERWEQDL
jgi:Ala-tRNA(Pro) deacylase